MTILISIMRRYRFIKIFNENKCAFKYFQAKAAVGSFKEAEETFMQVQSEKIRQDPVYILMLCRCCKATK